MSLAPKMDEVTEFILRHNTSLAFITETRLKDSVSDSVVQIPGFAVVRKDRKVIDHRGVCAYIQEGNCRYKQLKDLDCCEDHESLWLYLTPNRLPRGFSCIIAGVIYHPPKADWPLLRNHLFRSLALTEARYPNCGLLVTGDFNPLNIDGLLNHFRLKQIVKVPTRKKATLDFILTNMHEYYSSHKHTHRSGCPITTLLWQPLWNESATSTTKMLPWGVTCKQATRRRWVDIWRR